MSRSFFLAIIVVASTALAQQPASAPAGGAGSVHLLARYPAKLTGAMLDASQARPWLFNGAADVFRIASFRFEGPDGLKVETGPADLGIGHCDAGAIWAAIIPRAAGRLVGKALGQPEKVRSIWLRFHPSLLEALFPPRAVRGPGDPAQAVRILRIARHKLRASFHAGQRVLIPASSTLVVDVDTVAGVRRFFVIDRQADTTKYVAAFEQQAVPRGAAITRAQALDMFEQVWRRFDERYPMFVLRPKVDWDALRKRYEPRAARCTDAYALGQVLAEMLRSLRDMHVWVTVGGEWIPVFTRPRPLNANPRAAETILGKLHDAAGGVRWTRTGDDIGVIIIPTWTKDDIPAAVDDALNRLRDCRALVIDVRCNGGGNERLARRVAGRFAARRTVYAYQRYRNGPDHDDLTPMTPRVLKPRGPWRFDKPVIVLIGQRCISSNEAFVAMMGELPQVTLMGDHTAGSSGNPQWLRLDADLAVSVPRWIAYRADRRPLDERGIEPDVRFVPAPDAFTDRRDDLLRAGLDRARDLAEQP